jgi:formate dehydrogenase subunit gamma
MQAVLQDMRNPSAARPSRAPLDPEIRDRVLAIVGRQKDLAGAMLPILHEIQDALGYVPAETVPLIAEALNLSRAEVHGVISYYHHFRQTPAAANVLQICRAEACQARGADALVAHVQSALGCDFHGTSADGQFTLEPVFCLGLCSSGPNMMLGDDLHAQVSNAKFDRLVERALAARKEWP